MVLGVLRSGQLAQGPMVKQFEDGFAAFVGVDHTIAVNSGTTALIASLEVLDLRPGDEVVTSPFTFAATLDAILAAGATARFADIDEVDFAISTESVQSVLTDRTRCCFPCTSTVVCRC